MSEPLMMTIRCPRCGHTERLAVPTDQCVLVHECTACGAELRRRPGSCCVFCAHEDGGARAIPAALPPT